MATHSSILAWRVPWTEEPGGLQSMGSQRVRHDWAHTLEEMLCVNTPQSSFRGWVVSGLTQDPRGRGPCPALGKSCITTETARFQERQGCHAQGPVPRAGRFPSLDLCLLSLQPVLLSVTSKASCVPHIPRRYLGSLRVGGLVSGTAESSRACN